jgi:riboflavin kinase
MDYLLNILLYNYLFLSNIKFISRYSSPYIMKEHLELLLYISKKAGLFGQLKTSTLAISKELDISQQSISRKLREMEKSSLIHRSVSSNGVKIMLDKKGRDFLQKHYREISNIFRPKNKSISGYVRGGIGEGAYYVSQDQYKKQFSDKLGFDAYPGTLNVKINKEELAGLLAAKSPIKIDGFATEERSFGPLTAYKIEINSKRAAIVIPERTRHDDDIVEIIADVNLRDALGLKEKSVIEIR